MNLLAFGASNMFGPNTLIILVVLLVFFGAKRLPELARSLGQSIKEFQKGKDGLASTSEENPQIERPKA